MHAVVAFARSNSIGWMFLTVILGAAFILTGWLPLQLLGMVLIAVGVVTPIALTGARPDRHGVSSTRSTNTRRARTRHTGPATDEPSVSND